MKVIMGGEINKDVNELKVWWVDALCNSIRRRFSRCFSFFFLTYPEPSSREHYTRLIHTTIHITL